VLIEKNTEDPFPWGVCSSGTVSALGPKNFPSPQDSCKKDDNLGNPINPRIAEKFQVETDYLADDSIQFQRHYHSSNYMTSTAIGGHWRHTYDRRISFNLGVSITSTAYAVVTRETGQQLIFTRNANSTVWQSEPDITDTLISLTDSSGAIIGMELTTDNGSVETYDPKGKLLSIKNRSGRTQTLTYSDSSTYATVAPRPDFLIKVTDNFGKAFGFAYDNRGRLVSFSDPANKATLYSYDDVTDNLTKVSYPDNTSKNYLYNEPAYTQNTDLPHALTGIQDENNKRYATFNYNSNGQAISTEHFGSVNKYSVSYKFDTNGNPIGANITDPLGNTYTSNFQMILGVVKSTGQSQPGGSGCSASSNSIDYDSNGNLTSKTDFNGNKTCYAYDLSRNLETMRVEGLASTADCATALASTSLIKPARKISTEWHPTFRIPTKITEEGQQTAWAYDNFGNTTSKAITNAATGVVSTWSTTYTYSTTVASAILKKIIDGPRTAVTDTVTTDYYAPDAVCVGGHFGCRGRPQKITNGLGHITQISRYNAHGLPEESIDPNGLLTTLLYDARLRLSSATTGGLLTQLQYYPTGQLKQVTHPDNSYLLYTYDDAHRLIQINDNQGNKVVYALDAMGNRTQEDIFAPTGTLSQTHRYDFDNLGRLYHDLGANNQSTTYLYDSQGNLTDVIDPLNHIDSADYDALNRTYQTTDALGYTTKIQLDARDNVTSITDPRNNVTQYNLDGFDNRTQETSPDRGTVKYTYDASFNLSTVTDARGVVQTFTYDALKRPLTQTYTTVAGVPATGNVAWTYDQSVNSIGHLTTMTDETGNTTYSYDSLGRLLVKSQTTTLNGTSYTHKLKFTYNGQGQLLTQTTPSNLVITYGYDSNGRISSISANNQTILSNISYQAFGAPKSWTWASGQTYTRSFDADGHLTDYPLGSSNRHINYDNAGRIIGYSTNGTTNNRIFDYDDNDRLIGYTETDTTVSKGYEYDTNSNRSGITVGSVHYNYLTDLTNNRLNSTTGPAKRTYSYDASGNPLGDGSKTFIWNANGRLSTATTGANTHSYYFNGIGERVIKSSTSYPASPLRYIYDPAGHLIGEYNRNNGVVQETIWLGDLPVVMVKKIAGVYSFYPIHADHLNAPRVILNAANVPVWRWDNSDAFGLGSPNQDPDCDGTAITYNLRFPGQYYDKETGLHYNYFRDYDPNTGRYLESDPIGLAGGMNTYGYVGGNAVNAVDPTGLIAGVDDAAVIIGGSAIIISGCIATNCGDGMASAAKAAAQAANSAVQAVKELCETDDPCKKLNDDVQRAKDKVGSFKPAACSSGMSSWALQQRHDAWLEEALARTIRDQKCWAGGNSGHQQAQASAWSHVGQCSRLIQ